MKTLLIALVITGFFGQTSHASSHGEERALIAYMKVLPGTELQFLQEANVVIEKSRSESGNITYQLHQSVTNPQQFVFYELFTSDDALQYHRNSKHVKAFLKNTKSITVPGSFLLEEYQLYEAR